jgi:hypothetical protein
VLKKEEEEEEEMYQDAICECAMLQKLVIFRLGLQKLRYQTKVLQIHLRNRLYVNAHNMYNMSKINSLLDLPVSVSSLFTIVPDCNLLTSPTYPPPPVLWPLSSSPLRSMS